MAKGFDKVYAKSAVKAHNKFDLSRSHLTTLNIGQIIPIFNEEVVPGDAITVDASYFARLKPLNRPTYGKMDFKTATMYVPYHQVAEDADAFFAGKTYWQGSVPHVRHFRVRDILLMFVNSSSYVTGPLCTITTTEPSTYDFAFRDSDASSTQTYATFTTLGKYFYKVLTSLGYQIPEDGCLNTSSNWWNAQGSIKISAYPFLAAMKAYNDWMSMSQRFNVSQLSTLLLDIRQNRGDGTWYDPTDGHVESDTIYKMLECVVLSYENDYFTSAWLRPNSPLRHTGGGADTVEDTRLIYAPNVNGIASADVGVTADDFGTNVPLSSSKIWQRSLDFLKAFDDWVRRNNYAGSRDVQQVYARFGIKSDEYKTHLSEVLGTSSSPIQVGDVTATSALPGTNTQILGDYAGKGIVKGDSKFTFKCSDFGLVVTFAWISVRPMMPFGWDKKIMKSSPVDWFNPEFDAIGPQPISFGEVFEGVKTKHSDATTTSDEIYGFTERYNEYKYGRDQITGDFRVMTDMDTWHFARDLTDVRNARNMFAQSTSMNILPPDGNEFLRIFDDTTAASDHFYITAYFDVNAMRPMLNLSQAARLGTGDTVINKNGNLLN